MNKQKSIDNSLAQTLFGQRPLMAGATIALLLLAILSIASQASAQAAATAGKGKAFPTAQDAATSLIDAAEKYDERALEAIFGHDGRDIIHTGEPARDKENATTFASLARAKMTVDLNKAKTRAMLIIGDDEWPFPVPIVRVGTNWFFDANAGRREL